MTTNVLKTSVLRQFKSFKLALILLLGSGGIAHAQTTSYFQPFSVGAGYGITIAFAGEQTLTSSNAYNLNANCHFTPFISLSAEVQLGLLTGGDAIHDSFAKQFINDYKAFFLHGDVQLGEFIDYSHSGFLNGIKNIYAGIGAGILSNKISYIQTVNPIDTIPLTYAATSSNFVVPLRVGYEFKLFNQHDEPQFRFDIAYSFNTAFGQGLDGYTYARGSSVKFYNYISATLKFGFGGIRSYRKTVSYNGF